MNILSAAQTHALDQANITAQGLTSLELMERAATALTTWLLDTLQPAYDTPVLVFCGPGNNGADGLAVARQLHALGYAPQVWLLPAARHSPDYQANRQRLPAAVPCRELNPAQLPALPAGALVLDALFGTGLSRPLSPEAAAVVERLNAAPNVRRVAVDMPSGLPADAPLPPGAVAVQAHYTVSFELPKLAFLLPQSGDCVGRWAVLPIGLDAEVIHKTPVDNYYITPELLITRLPERQKFAHKGTYGHALLLAGSRGKVGAAVLAAGGCLRGGVGLLSVGAPEVGYQVLQTAVPEAMTLPDLGTHHLAALPPELAPYAAIGLGPGIGQHDDTRRVLEELLRTAKAPLVLDADALNLLGTHRELLALLPPNTVLTPHPKEFERLTEPARHDYHRLELLRHFCQQHHCYVVLKGAHTAIGTPQGQVYFNSTGNPGMATGGSGDVLTGLLLALRADQRLSPLDAVLLGVYAHGLAGDLAATHTGQPGLLASDLVAHIGPALRELETR